MDEPKKRVGPMKEQLVAERLDDLTVYIRLLNLAEELEWLSNRCWSVVAESALQVAARVVRTTASGLYRASLDW